MGPRQRGRYCERAPSPAWGRGRTSSLGWRWKQGRSARSILTPGSETGRDACRMGSPARPPHRAPRHSLDRIWTPHQRDLPWNPSHFSAQAPLMALLTGQPFWAASSPFLAGLGSSPLCFHWLLFSGCPATKPNGMNDQRGRKMEQKQKGPYALHLCHSE